MSVVNGVVRVRADGRRRLGPPTQTILADAKWRQANKINEIKAALIDAGRAALDEQAKALGLRRSTTWAILTGTHKASGISAGIVIRMLSAPVFTGTGPTEDTRICSREERRNVWAHGQATA